MTPNRVGGTAPESGMIYQCKESDCAEVAFPKEDDKAPVCPIHDRAMEPVSSS